MHFVYGFCNGNARAAVEEYQRRFSDRRIPSRGVFTFVHQTMRETFFRVLLCSLKWRWHERLTHERTFFRWFREVHACPLVEWSLALAYHVCRCGELQNLHEENLYPYDDQRVKHLEPGNHAQRLDLCHCVTAHPELLSVILFSDDASFTRDGINYLRNVLTWSHENPQETRVTKYQRRFSLNVWCGVLGNKLIGPFVFDENLTGNRYEAFLRNQLPGLLEDIPLIIRSQMHFQHDGAPTHYTRHVREYLIESFPNRWLGRGKPVAWPPRSPDLTPLDFYLWGHIKTLVYETKVESRAALRDRIFAASEHIRNHPDNIASATQSLLMRAENCIRTGGGHFKQLL